MSHYSEKSFNWKIAGKAGEGVMVAGKLLAKAAKKHGWQAFNYLEYPSLIKGAHQTAQVFASEKSAKCQRKYLDLLINFNENGFSKHKDEITENTVIIYNSNSGELDLGKYPHIKDGQVFKLPLYDFAKETAGTTLATNSVSLGISAYFLGLDKQVFIDLLTSEFQKKGQGLVDKNVTALNKGYEQASWLRDPIVKQINKQADEMIVLNGNEAVGMGAVAAGIEFYSAYPMTPATGLLHYLALAQNHYPIVVKHTEDEIGAINQAIGASVAGARSMTGTSGGGFALMAEGLSFAGVAEVPIVIHEAQRTGPASGLPTWTAQADLQFVLYGGHGDFVRVVLTPGSVQEHFELAMKAFYLAEKYQIPVFILSDKYILESHQTMPKPQDQYNIEKQSMLSDKDLKKTNDYLRYKITENGISPRTIPGQENGLGLTNSYEHDEFGYATEEIDMTVAQVDKRARKLQALVSEVPEPFLYGPEEAEVTFVGWGSTINVLEEVVNSGQSSVNAIHIPCIMPLPIDKLKELMSKAKKLVMVEGNQSGQAEKYITCSTGIQFTDHLRRYDGRPFYIEDLIEYSKGGK